MPRSKCEWQKTTGWTELSDLEIKGKVRSPQHDSQKLFWDKYGGY